MGDKDTPGCETDSTENNRTKEREDIYILTEKLSTMEKESKKRLDSMNRKKNRYKNKYSKEKKSKTKTENNLKKLEKEMEDMKLALKKQNDIINHLKSENENYLQTFHWFAEEMMDPVS